MPHIRELSNQDTEDLELIFQIRPLIAKTEYYRHAKDKQLAIQQNIQLNYADAEAVKKFLKESKYYKDTSL